MITTTLLLLLLLTALFIMIMIAPHHIESPTGVTQAMIRAAEIRWPSVLRPPPKPNSTVDCCGCALRLIVIVGLFQLSDCLLTPSLYQPLSMSLPVILKSYIIKLSYKYV